MCNWTTGGSCEFDLCSHPQASLNDLGILERLERLPDFRGHCMGRAVIHMNSVKVAGKKAWR